MSIIINITFLELTDLKVLLISCLSIIVGGLILYILKLNIKNRIAEKRGEELYNFKELLRKIMLNSNNNKEFLTSLEKFFEEKIDNDNSLKESHKKYYKKQLNKIGASIIKGKELEKYINKQKLIFTVNQIYDYDEFSLNTIFNAKKSLIIIEEFKQFQPFVKLDSASGVVIIKGYFRLNNTSHFFKPIINWIDSYSLIEKKELTVDFKIKYANSASYKFIGNIIMSSMELKYHNKTIVLNWYYEEEDEDMYGVGEDLEMMTNTKINLIPINKIDMFTLEY